MFLEILKMFILAQTEQEKSLTFYGLLFLVIFVGVGVLDSFSKGKLVPTKGPIKSIVLVVFVIIIAVLIFMTYIYK